MQSINFKFILRTEVPRKSGECIIALQAFLQKKRVVINTGIAVLPSRWDALAQRIIVNGRSAAEMVMANHNKHLELMLFKCSDILWRAEHLGKIVTPDVFKRELIRAELKIDFIHFMRTEMDALKGSRGAGTWRKYLQTWLKLRECYPALPFANMDYDFVITFNDFLNRQKLAPNTISKHHKIVKVFINIAHKKDIVFPNPYQNFATRQYASARSFLSGSELRQMNDLYKSTTCPDKWSRVLQYFLFSCFTGLRMSDLKTVMRSNIVNNTMVLMPQKTKHINKFITIPLNDTALGFIAASPAKLFNTVSEVHSNRILKELCDFLGIRKKITMHTGRHTFATQFLQSGGKVEVLQRLLGHDKIETTMIYVHMVDDAPRDQIMGMDGIV